MGALWSDVACVRRAMLGLWAALLLCALPSARADRCEWQWVSTQTDPDADKEAQVRAPPH